VKGKVIIFAAPSGAGKTTISRYVLSVNQGLQFSVSAATRLPRQHEKDGVDYHFMTKERFKELVAADAFVEWEEVYSGHYYGTLKAEVERIWNAGKHVVFDVDVKGAIHLKEIYGDQALAIFVMPPSIDVLEKRLRIRGADSPEAIKMRVNKAFSELSDFKSFDVLILNDRLEKAKDMAVMAVRAFLKN
jgi:guanylate kinase